MDAWNGGGGEGGGSATTKWGQFLLFFFFPICPWIHIDKRKVDRSPSLLPSTPHFRMDPVFSLLLFLQFRVVPSHFFHSGHFSFSDRISRAARSAGEGRVWKQRKNVGPPDWMAVDHIPTSLSCM